ncbi:MAG: LytTR family DNA-binding domain-containing protein [Lachnospiraceae bacterium]|nr:LytTR family DNA-binding domain-containing protein [Lachnospiraceae bacterium]
MHFAIVEDLKTDQENLSGLLREELAAHGETADLSIYGSGETFLTDFRRGFCSAVFLDIMLGGGMTGIDTAWKIRELDEYIPIIFTTTESGFALESYGVHAMDFLVKPVQAKALGWCMKRLRGVLAAPVTLNVRTVDEDGQASSRLVLLDHIIYTESIRNGLLLHTTDGEIKTRQSYMEIVQQIPKSGRFFECSRGLAVNFSFVSEVLENGEIRLTGGQKLFCSRRKIKETITAWHNYQFMVLRNEGQGC